VTLVEKLRFVGGAWHAPTILSRRAWSRPNRQARESRALRVRL